MATDAVSIVSLALQAVSTKAVIILSLIMVFSLFCWALWMHEWIALAVAGTFALLVFLPVLFRVSQGAQNARENG